MSMTREYVAEVLRGAMLQTGGYRPAQLIHLTDTVLALVARERHASVNQGILLAAEWCRDHEHVDVCERLLMLVTAPILPADLLWAAQEIANMQANGWTAPQPGGEPRET